MMPDYDDVKLRDKARLLDEMMAVCCNKCPVKESLIKSAAELRDVEAMGDSLKRENESLRLRVRQLEAEKRGDLT
jgi:hypothetical protein